MAAKSEFLVEVVRLDQIEKHPNADTLSIATVNGYPVIFKTGDFEPGDLAVYVPVDALVPTSRPEFSFLKKGDAERHRIKAVRLRGVFSMGLLVPWYGGPFAEGDDVQEALQIEKWVPPSERTLEQTKAAGATKAQRDPGFMPVYGLDAFRRYSRALQPGEEVVITEKIHGCNARYAYRNGRLHVGSHRTYRGATPSPIKDWLNRAYLKILTVLGINHRAHLFAVAGDVWWSTAQQYDLSNKLRNHPNLVVYGEIYGEGVQDLKYDSPSGRRFRVFDILDIEAGKYYPHDQLVDFCALVELPMVPVLYRGPWRPELVELAEGPSTLANHLREGFVVKPVNERFDVRVGRVALKLVSESYLLRKEAA